MKDGGDCPDGDWLIYGLSNGEVVECACPPCRIGTVPGSKVSLINGFIIICLIFSISHAADLDKECADYTGKVVTTYPVYKCKPAKSPPKIDGKLDDEAWAKAELIPEFKLFNGKATAQYKTEIRMLYDADNLYAGFIAFDTDIWAKRNKHDEPLCEDEVVEIFIDEDSSGSGYVEVEINCLNAIFDLYILPEGKAVSKWDITGIETAVHINGTINDSHDTDNYWSGELKIPFINFVSARRIPPSTGDSWRINFYRIERNRNEDEYSAWSPVYTVTPDFHKPEWFGLVIFE